MSDQDARKQEIIDRLSTVTDPEMGRDIVSLGQVSNVTHCDGAVRFGIELPHPGPEARDRAEKAAREAVEALEWVTRVKIDLKLLVSAGAQQSAGAMGKVKNIIAVASGKGGVGKSTVAVNLAAGLVRLGASVGLLDADIYGPSIPVMLGTRARPEAVDGPEGQKMFAAVEAHGIRLMSMGFLVEEDRPVIWRGPMLHGALKQFFEDVAWGELDYLVVDLPPGTGDVSLTMAQSINVTGAVVVSTPQAVAMIDARKALNMFRETGIEVLGIVENMAGEVFGSGSAGTWAQKEGIRFLGSIPLDSAIRVSGDAGRPVVLDEEAAASKPMMDFVSQVATAVAAKNAAAPARKPISIKR